MKAMKRILLLCAAAFGLSVASAEAQESEWDKLVAAAKKEGEVTMFQSGNPGRRQWLMARWKKDFPDIKIDPTMLVGGPMLTRLKVEREAGKYLWDLSIGGPNALYAEIPSGLLDPLLPELVLPEVKDEAVWGGWSTAFYDTQRTYILGPLKDFEPVWYNAKLVSPAEVKQKGIRILLDPAYRGKTIWTDPRDNGPGQLFDDALPIRRPLPGNRCGASAVVPSRGRMPRAAGRSGAEGHWRSPHRDPPSLPGRAAPPARSPKHSDSPASPKRAGMRRRPGWHRASRLCSPAQLTSPANAIGPAARRGRPVWTARWHPQRSPQPGIPPAPSQADLRNTGAGISIP